MLRKLTLLNVFSFAALLFTACTPAAKTPDAMMATTPTGAMMEQPTKTADAMMQPTGTMMANSTPTADTMMGQGTVTPTADAMMDHGTPAPTGDGMLQPTDAMGQSIPSTGMSDQMAATWVAKDLTDPVSGQRFKISDFKGKVVLVEPFAQSCAACLTQQQEFAKLNKMMGMPGDLVIVSLDADSMDHVDGLKAYMAQHMFDWRFAVASAQTVQDFGQLYGPSFSSPANAPLLVIDRQGQVHPLGAGVKSAADLQKALEPYLKAGM